MPVLHAHVGPADAGPGCDAAVVRLTADIPVAAAHGPTAVRRGELGARESGALVAAGGVADVGRVRNGVGAAADGDCGIVVVGYLERAAMCGSDLFCGIIVVGWTNCAAMCCSDLFCSIVGSWDLKRAAS